MAWKHRITGLALLFTLTAQPLAAGYSANAQTKATHVIKLAQFIKWPNKKQGKTMVFCALESNPVGIAAKKQEPITIKKRPLQVNFVRLSDSMAHCHIVFFARNEIGNQHLSSLLQKLSQNSVLTVSDAPNFSANQGMIEIFETGKGLKYKINQAAMHRANLYASTKILKMATQVYRKGKNK